MVFNCFRDKFDGYVFVDSGNGTEHSAIVEFAPNQKAPRSAKSFEGKKPKAADPKVSTRIQHKIRLFLTFSKKTQAQKNSRLQKTQGNFGSKLNEMVVMVVTQTLELIIFRDICAQTWPVTQNCPKQTEKGLFFAEILQILALKSL